MNYSNTIIPFINTFQIVSVTEEGQKTIVDFINPCNGQVERVVFEHPSGDGKIESILYVPSYFKDGEMYTKDEYDMEDLNELNKYIFIDGQ